MGATSNSETTCRWCGARLCALGAGPVVTAERQSRELRQGMLVEPSSFASLAKGRSSGLACKLVRCGGWPHHVKGGFETAPDPPRAHPILS
jgi:hypothetical protein